jgi:hypothetical protein
LYPPNELKADKEYVLKKLGLTPAEFEEIMKLPLKRHQDFRTDTKLKESYMNLLRKTEPARAIIKKILSR